MARKQTCYAGNTRLRYSEADIQGDFTEIDGEEFYAIRGVQNMEPFFMSVVSASDHWMFIASNGALTAGRRDPGNALFPYCPVDKIYDSAEITGSKTIVRVKRGRKTRIWEPLSDRMEGLYSIRRTLYKNIAGNRLIFEEVNEDLALCFAYQWTNSEKFGFVKKSSVTSLSDEPAELNLLDGIQNILPYGVDRMMQADKSCLVDAYKKCELVAETGLGIYTLSSIPVDRAEPSESLIANTAWSHGGGIGERLLSSKQAGSFRRGMAITGERDIAGKRGAYFVNVRLQLPPRERRTWYIVADVNQTAAKVAGLNALLSSNPDMAAEIETDVTMGVRRLTRIVASADGLQCTADKRSVSRHFANVLFNVMRGGIFDDGYAVSRRDLLKFAAAADSVLFRKEESWLQGLPETLHYSELIRLARATGNAELIRQCLEYMPLTFGRRHGDPSRPWNLFAIETRKDDGTKLLGYQGNWRDIFQNWEALALSFPGYIESMISKFVNASTVDGYNPYRVTREGFDWEIQDPHDPWSFIGYWGDHQTIYLLKLLEIAERYHPGSLQRLLASEIFSYANVPYRMRDYRSVLRDPYHSIDYDEKLEMQIAARVRERGGVGKVIWDGTGGICLVNLAEKLLVSLLARLTNFVPEGGIWMNTQRPEWNDANNALAGYGLSMVTLYYLRRYLAFCQRLFSRSAPDTVSLSREVAELLGSVHSILLRHRSTLAGGFENRTRRALLDALGEAATVYRARVYSPQFPGARSEVAVGELKDFISLALEYMDQSIRANRRPDGLYHSYNLLSVQGDDELEVSHLYEMLEGQVAILSSGYLPEAECIHVLEALRKSAMFREDQYSYILYPARTLPRFVEKNNLPAGFTGRSELIRRLDADDNKQLVEKDIRGVFHFNGAFTNRNAVSGALDSLALSGYGDLVEQEREAILGLYEDMFGHKSFTGRSGSFYSYEGLGSIYWHMVSKLLLAVEEVFAAAVDKGTGEDAVSRLRAIYYDVRKGLGTDKTPAEYGAFPMDPYSHTPSHSGAQQPGMTGQVKEDIITRFRELGLTVSGGRIRFEPALINPGEFLSRPALFRFVSLNGTGQSLTVDPQSLAYTFCQVPVILRISHRNAIHLVTGRESRTVEGLEIGEEESRSVFERSGRIDRIEVELQFS